MAQITPPTSAEVGNTFPPSLEVVPHGSVSRAGKEGATPEKPDRQAQNVLAVFLTNGKSAQLPSVAYKCLTRDSRKAVHIQIKT